MAQRDWERVNESTSRLRVPGGWVYRTWDDDGIAMTFVPSHSAITVLFRESDQIKDADEYRYRVLKTVSWDGDELPGEWLSWTNLYELIKDDFIVTVIGDQGDFLPAHPKDVTQ